jgi:hypothetical protein
VIYNSGRYRMAGRGSLAGLLPYGDANAIVVDMAREVLPVVKRTPVLAGVNGTDPFRGWTSFSMRSRRSAFAGVQNFPTVGLIDGILRANLEETGMSYGLEVDMIATAHKKDLLTTPYVFNEGEAGRWPRGRRHHRLPPRVDDGRRDRRADGAEACRLSRPHRRLGERGNEAVAGYLVLAHGGPIAEPADADYIMKSTKICHGFYGASSMERLPVETRADRAGPPVQSDRPALKWQSASAQADGKGGVGNVGALDRDADPLAHHRDHRRGRRVYVVNWLYHRSSKEVSFVRTGFLGERVVINGGAFVLPFIHDFTPVNMNVLPMQIVRSKGDALITRDRMRIDIEADFYVRVQPRARRWRSPRRRSAGVPSSLSGCMRFFPASSCPPCARSPPR